MIVRVHLLAFGRYGEYREVDIPEAEEGLAAPYEKPLPGDNGHTFLERVFYWGQNDHQPQDKPSVSVGDVVEKWGKYWLCVPVGWKELSESQWLNYLGMSLVDRQVFCWGFDVPNVLRINQ